MKNTKQLIMDLENREFDSQFKDIYVDEAILNYETERYTKAVQKYEALFGEAEVNLFSAPGRSEVCGNHTDHQHGMVLATSINLDTIAVVGNVNPTEIKVVSEGYDMITLDVRNLEVRESEKGTTESLIRGVLKGLVDRGYDIGGFTAYLTSDVLVGAGLSSSAAFEVVIGTIISGLYNDMKISSVEIAQIAQYAENVYFGKPCGLMDQMACSVGGMVHIDFADPKKPIVNKIEADFDKNHYSLCIVDTKGSHADLTEDYALIPQEMKQVAEYMGKEVLRDVDQTEFNSRIPELREKLGDRPVLRALHFYNEEGNVAHAVESLSAENLDKFLEFIRKSGNSSFKYLQNVYVNRDVQNQNMSMALAVSEQVLSESEACRVHGGGFAGTILAFVKNENVKEYKETMDGVFGIDACHVLKVRNYGGVQVL